MRFLPFFALLIMLAACAQEKASEQQWYKGNLHTHSMWSDGDDFPEMIMDWYKSNGYHFIGLSDHNILAEGEKWKRISGNSNFESAFKKYLDSYGTGWVEVRLDSQNRIEVRLKTLEEYRPLFEEPGQFLIIKSEEISDYFDKKPIHMNVTNIRELIEPQGGNSVADVLQRNIDKVLEQRETTGQPMFPHINHPNFVWTISVADIIALEGERFFEVYNGHPLVNNYGDSLRPGMEVVWDLVQTAYLEAGKAPLYGLAVDDAHNYHTFGGTKSNPGRGWVMVKADTLSPEALIQAMEQGDFYATTGVLLETVDFDGSTLKISVSPEEGVDYTIRFFGTKSSDPSNPGTLLLEVVGTQASYQLQRDDLYVRAKVISNRLKANPYQEGDYEVAWTQPFNQ